MLLLAGQGNPPVEFIVASGARKEFVEGGWQFLFQFFRWRGGVSFEPVVVVLHLNPKVIYHFLVGIEEGAQLFEVPFFVYPAQTPMLDLIVELRSVIADENRHVVAQLLLS